MRSSRSPQARSPSRCVGDVVQSCAQDGGASSLTCPLGCVETQGVARCQIGSYVSPCDAARVDGTTAALVIPLGEWRLDSVTGAITRTDGEVLRRPGKDVDGSRFWSVAQSEAPTVACLAAGSIIVAKGATVRVVGPNAVALLADVLLVDGVVDGSCDLDPFDRPTNPGPGARPSLTADTQAGRSGSGVGSGGGGGGNGAAGASGGSAKVGALSVAGGQGGAAPPPSTRRARSCSEEERPGGPEPSSKASSVSSP